MSCPYSLKIYCTLFDNFCDHSDGHDTCKTYQGEPGHTMTPSEGESAATKIESMGGRVAGMAKRGIINPLFGMTDAAFWGKIRAGLRKQWMYSEAYKQAIQKAKKSYKDGKRQYKIICANCGSLWNIGERINIQTKKGTLKGVLAYQVDHRDECGSLNSFADISPFAERLFTGSQEVLCYNCHQAKTHRGI